MKSVAAFVGAATTALCGMQSAAVAQSMTPMRGEVSSFDDNFAVRVAPGNPYTHRIKVEVKVYDEQFRPVPAFVMPRETLVAAQDRRTVMVLIPFDGKPERKVRICAESVPFENQPTRLRTQVCGKFLARHVRS